MGRRRTVGAVDAIERYGRGSHGCRTAMTPPVVWERDGEAYYASVEDGAGGVRLRLVVEKMNGSWDWTVWKPDNPETSVRHGVSNIAQDAMREAERAI
jgi:hypothetical protein